MLDQWFCLWHGTNDGGKRPASQHLHLTIHAETPEGETVTETAFVSLAR
jgi:hypothetical protein